MNALFDDLITVLHNDRLLEVPVSEFANLFAICGWTVANQIDERLDHQSLIGKEINRLSALDEIEIPKNAAEWVKAHTLAEPFATRVRIAKTLLQWANEKNTKQGGKTNHWNNHITVQEITTYPAHFLTINYLPEYRYHLQVMAQSLKGLTNYQQAFFDEQNRMYKEITKQANEQLYPIFKKHKAQGMDLDDSPSKYFPDPFATHIPSAFFPTREDCYAFLHDAQHLVTPYDKDRDNPMEVSLQDNGRGYFFTVELKAWKQANKELHRKWYNTIKQNNN